MKIEKCRKESFAVIGKEGSTLSGEGFIAKLWQDANEHFPQIAALTKRDESGNLIGIWGAMSDFSRSFLPWEDGFSKGLYLAGAECRGDAEAPEGWVKWTVPAYEYLRVPNEAEDSFSQMIRYLQENDLPLAGAVHEYTDPQSGKEYLYFPIQKL